jgi:hypothetical protein
MNLKSEDSDDELDTDTPTHEKQILFDKIPLHTNSKNQTSLTNKQGYVLIIHTIQYREKKLEH